MSAQDDLRRTAVAQQHSSADRHGVSVKPSRLLALLDRLDQLEAALTVLLSYARTVDIQAACIQGGAVFPADLFPPPAEDSAEDGA